MRLQPVLLAAFATTVSATIKPKNFIFIVPDGMAPASETLARTYLAMINGDATPQSPNIPAIGIDELPIGNTRTHSANNLVTDSAAAGTALAAGVKTNNGVLSVLPNGQPVGTILEAAKMAGFLTALVVTSEINHATPAAFSSHVVRRSAFPEIAEQQIGYSHPLNQSVDIMLGGGRCYFQPQSDPNSCREDDIDLFAYAEEKGYYVAQDRSDFDRLRKGTGQIRLPYVGLFNDGGLHYDIDRQQQPEAEREPSLAEMTETALDSLEREVSCRGRDCIHNRPDKSGKGKPGKGGYRRGKGFFMVIESSRIDHAMHAHDGVAHLHDVLEYNRVVDLVREWIDEHPDTVMLSVADHETGGLTIPGNYDPRPIAGARNSVEQLTELWEASDKSRAYLTNEVFPRYGVSNPSTAETDSVMNSSRFGQALADVLNRRTRTSWSTGGHSGVDTTLYGYAAGRLGNEMKVDLAGGHDNTELPRYIEEALDLDMDRVTRELRARGTDWIPQ